MYANKLKSTALVVSSMTLLLVSVVSRADTGWQPITSERLVKLPVSQVDRRLEQSFRQSALAERIFDLSDNAAHQGQSLSDIRAGLEMAEDDARIALQHQYLEEKSRHLDTLQERHALREQELTTKVRVLEGLMRKLRSNAVADDTVTMALVEKQKAARERLENSMVSVDTNLFDALPGSQSEYAEAYEEHTRKLAQLTRAIQQHPANQAAQIDGQEVTREAYVRHLITRTQSELALLAQEEEMLGYMAKLVALDAQSLQDELENQELDEKGNPTRIASAVDHFI
ncbi:MAG: hypothetical protein AAF529_00670 [Pseudomonadota bacterium]